MRLLKASSLELAEFWDNEIPPYAILSHTWEEEEVSFQDMQTGNAKNKAGYAKIMACCRRALLDGHNYVWIDTCCIEKSSSAELTEAINSMYQWYQDAKTCYVYLSDVESIGQIDPASPPESVEQIKALAQSRWFTRGWTLQELIAPSSLRFYSKYWVYIGSKSDLTGQLSMITGVSVDVLGGRVSPGYSSVAARMSWASRRETTRVEDMAYCLMGLFGINMPLLYGEGRKAFIRLQQEIIKISNDHSIFAWTQPLNPMHTGIFADSPRCFSRFQNIVGTYGSETSIPSTITNRGLQIELVLVPGRPPPKRFIALLNCIDLFCSDCPIGIMMEQTPGLEEAWLRRGNFNDIFTVAKKDLGREGLKLKSEVCYIREFPESVLYEPVYRYKSSEPHSSSSFVCYEVHPFHMWIPYR